MYNKVRNSPYSNNCLGIKTTDLDDLIAETSAYLNIQHPDFSKVASRVSITKLHKETHEQFKDVIDQLYHYKDEITGKKHIFLLHLII